MLYQLTTAMMRVAMIPLVVGIVLVATGEMNNIVDGIAQIAAVLDGFPRR